MCTKQVTCNVQATDLVHICELNRLLVHFTGYCTVQVTYLVHICEPNRLFVHFPG